MDKSKIAFYFSGLVLVAALLRWPTYTFPFRTLGTDNFWTLEIIMSNALSLAFLFLPVFAFLGFLRHWRSAYICLGLSPVVFFLFGSVPIPFAGYLYSSKKWGGSGLGFCLSGSNRGLSKITTPYQVDCRDAGGRVTQETKPKT